MHSAYQFNAYLLKRQVLALSGTFRVFDSNGNLALYSRQKLLRLKEDIRVFSDESKSQELLNIQARQVIDFSAAYDVNDSTTGERVGMLRRKGFRSVTRDEWHVFDANNQQIGVLIEDNLQMALIRRFLAGSFFPQNYDLLAGDQRLADYRQRFNPFRYELEIEFPVLSSQFDRRIGLSAAILLAAIEGRQE